MNGTQSPYGIDEETLHRRALRLTEALHRLLDLYGINEPWTRVLKNKMRDPEDLSFDPVQAPININLTPERVVEITVEFAKQLSYFGYPIASDEEYHAWYVAIQKRIKNWGYLCPEELYVDWSKYTRRFTPS